MSIQFTPSPEPDLTCFKTPDHCSKCKTKTRSGRFMDSNGRYLCIKCSDIELGYAKPKSKKKKS